MTSLPATVRRTIARYRMFRPGVGVVVAVSGGPDSLALLHLLARLRPSTGISLVAAHLDHGFRPEGAAEAAFVRARAEEWKVPFVGGRVDVPRLVAKSRGPQDAARQARYAFLARVADEAGAEIIAVGHTADDQAETVLMHLLRGTGAGGLAGMAAVAGRVVRPMLEAWRAQVEAYCRHHVLEPLRDPSNADPKYLRNRIRAELLPVLEGYNPRIRERLVAMARTLADERDLMEDLAKHAEPNVQQEGAIDQRAFLALPRAVQRTVLRRLSPSLTAVQVEAALRAVEVSADPGTPHKPPPPADVTLPMPGIATLERLGVRVEARQCARCAAAGPQIAHIDLDPVTLPLTVGPRRRGERFQPLGMRAAKRLQDFLVDRKVPRWQRDALPMVRDPNGIIWIPGHTVAERARLRPSTTRILHLEVRPL
jgi:tRNA(Ile)-lysidine synthase